MDKELRENLRKVVSWGEAHTDWKKAIDGVSKSKRGVRPSGLASLGLGAFGAYAARAMGHSRFLPQSQTFFSQMAGGILAENSRASQ